jgi:hypothetical protein
MARSTAKSIPPSWQLNRARLYFQIERVFMGKRKPTPEGLESRSLGDFLGTVEQIRKRWKKTDGEDLWFRGERQQYGTSRLKPKLYRESFKKGGGRLKELLELEVGLFGDFQRCGGPLCDRLPQDEWEWYFLMQYYGGPTRLLDRSDGALMALHFAIRDYPRAAGDALVYVLDSNWLAGHLDDGPEYNRIETIWRAYSKRHPDSDKEEWVESYLPQETDVRKDIALPKVPLIWDPSHVTTRFAAQRRRFMIFGNDPDWLARLAAKRGKLCAITMKHRFIPEIKRELRSAGVTESVIFPDLDGLGREQSQLWEDRRG